jgi:hypothetical protein
MAFNKHRWVHRSRYGRNAERGVERGGVKREGSKRRGVAERAEEAGLIKRGKEVANRGGEVGWERLRGNWQVRKGQSEGKWDEG